MVKRDPEWLNQPESERLEYKGSDSLANSETIVRVVVALLNRTGGRVVVGADDAGRPDGQLREPALSRDRLQRRLIDAIEPRPIDRVVVHDQEVLGAHVLVVEVRASKTGQLYAERRHGLYGFWVRSGPTTRAYSLAEVKEYWANDFEAPKERWDRPLVEANEPGIVFVLHARSSDPFDPAGMERTLDPEQRHQLTRRRMGWSIIDEYDEVNLKRNAFQVGTKGSRTWLFIDTRSGLLRFEGRADFLRWKPHTVFGREVIYPFPLVEGTASLFWLLDRYAHHTHVQGRVCCQLGIWRPQGWRLGPSRPGTLIWDATQRWQPPHDNTSVERIAYLDWSEIRDRADQAAYPFVAEVYEDFGYDEAAIPFWNPESGRFRFG